MLKSFRCYDNKESVRLIFVYLIEGSDKTFEKIND